MPRPAAYLRKTTDSATKQEHLDRLLRTIEEHRPGEEPVVHDDWARSGDRAKLASRRQWAELCAAIEAGAVDAVFMNDLDRGGRSLEEHLRFIRVAQEMGCRVIAGGVDYSLPENKDRLVFEGWLAERELDAAKRRARETIRMRRRRGDKIGGTRYGWRFAKDETGRVIEVPDPERPLGPVLGAVRDAGNSIPEAVRLLNERQVPSRFGRRWSQHSLRALLARERAMPPRSRRPRRTRNGSRLPSPLSRLVRCHCGNLMTPVDAQGKLYCYLGARDGMARHGKHTVSQRRVWVAIASAAEELGRETVAEHVHSSGGEGAAARLAAAQEELRRLGRAYRAGAVDDEEFDREGDRLAAEAERAREEMDAEDVTIRVRMERPAVDLRLRESDPVRLGEQLRAAFREVRLGPDLRPAELVRR